MSTMTINWVLPTVRADGSPLAASEIASVSVFDMASANPSVAVADLAGSATSATLADPAVGDHGYTVVVTDTGGRVGLPSKVAVITVAAPPPPVAIPGPATDVVATFTS